MILKFIKEGKQPYKLVESYEKISDIVDDSVAFGMGPRPSFFYSKRPIMVSGLFIDENGNYKLGKNEELNFSRVSDENIDIVYIDENRISEITSEEAMEALRDYRNSKLNSILNLSK